jgi:hypothetical protein
MSTRAWVVAAVVALLLPGCSGGDGGGGGPEPVELQVVGIPASVTGARYPIYSADGERILFSGVPAGSTRVEVMSVADDGSDLRCLSCDAARGDDAPLLKPLPFRDGTRVAVRVGEQSPLQPAGHAVLECTPSTADCRSAALVPITVPAAGDASVVQGQRELRLSPDGQTVAFSQVRRRPGGDNAFVAVVGRLRRAGDGTAYEVAGPRVVSTLGELKNFTPDGRAVLVAAFTTLPDRVANADIVEVDLASGEQRAVTVDGDYDEDISLSPDGRWYVVASGRGSGYFETVSQVRRPNFLGPGIEPLTAYLFAHHRRELLEPWLVRVGAERDGDRGQQLNPGSRHEGYDARVLMSWHPRGDRVLFWEGRSDPFGPPSGTTRIVVARLTGRHGVAPRRVERSPVPGWAPALAGFQPPPFPAEPSRAGEATGTATVSARPGPRPGQRVVEVRYDGFSDDGVWVVDGTESATYDEGTLGTTRYTADLTLSGAHDGYLRADATISAGGFDGTIESAVDGRALRLP